MDEKEFLTKLAELMDTEEELSLDKRLGEIEEWDSLSYVAFMAFAHNTFKRELERQAVRQAETVGDLYKLVMQ
ncbi:MAG: hypothetical protein IJU00_13140 [Selenomonas sp.]|nr:hypothetical protein [Selenomonas sp.]